MIRISKAFTFEASHALWNYAGKCRNIHGHSYRLVVTVSGSPATDEDNPKTGMVMDFGDLKKLVKALIIDKYDHAVIVWEKAPYETLKKTDQMFENLVVTTFQPTCENMAREFAGILQKNLPSFVSLHSVRLYETETSWAEWCADNNPAGCE
ncbi:MAG: 6-carboxytetrahydropterin synthase QueD [Bacteroidetes bacterium]|nr:6-carboxytetrahydropterin synthase QueD [Bacteroidota bacterium]